MPDKDAPRSVPAPKVLFRGSGRSPRRGLMTGLRQAPAVRARHHLDALGRFVDPLRVTLPCTQRSAEAIRTASAQHAQASTRWSSSGVEIKRTRATVQGAMASSASASHPVEDPPALTVDKLCRLAAARSIHRPSTVLGHLEHRVMISPSCYGLSFFDRDGGLSTELITTTSLLFNP